MRVLVNSKVEKCSFSKDTYLKREYLVNEEEYVTTNGIKFKLRTYELTLTDKDGDESTFFRKTEVDYNDKVIIGNDGIPGSGNVKQSVNKAKRWLDKNDSKVLSGGKYRYKSS